MELIANKNELIANIKTLDGYLESRVDPDFTFAVDLVKRGTCFVTQKKSDTYRFYPSRFIGYSGNSRNAHLDNEAKDGKETNPVISKILNCKPLSNTSLNREYQKYCEMLGFVPMEKGAFGVERKFWEVVF